MLHYLLNYLFLLGFSFTCIYYGPVMMYRSISPDYNELKHTELKKFELDYFSPKQSKQYENVKIVQSFSNQTNRKYFELSSIFDTIKFTKIYRIDDRQFMKISTFLFNEGYLATNTLDVLKDSLPIILSSDELKKIKVVFYQDKKARLKFLKFGNTAVMGNNFGLFGRVLQFIFGLILFVAGPVMLYVGNKVVIDNIKIYRKTGSLPRLTNKANGIKFLLGKRDKN